MSLENKLDFWIKNNYNVLFKGKHGVGKSALVIDAFNKAGLKWLYFSASTMDPFVDFVGIPKEVKDDKGNSYLDLIRPKALQNDEIEAIFLDEFNRASSKKIKNAVMELIQFKSINGKKFNKLKVVWAAINPDDEKDLKYDVEELDPAQVDRFHVQIDVPYLPSSPYFKNKYGEDIAFVAINWWKELPKEAQNNVSPRRLDYAIDMYNNGGDIRDVLPKNVETNKLLLELKSGPVTKQLKHFYIEKDVDGAKKFLTAENNYSICIEKILKDHSYVKFFAPLLSDEKISSLAVKHESIVSYLIENYVNHVDLVKSIAKANTNKKIVNRLQTVINAHDLQRAVLLSGDNSKIDIYYNNDALTNDFKSHLELCKKPAYSTQARIRQYHIIRDSVPKHVTLEDAKQAYKILIDILCRSNANTIKQSYNDIIPIINHLVTFLLADKKGYNFTKKDLDLLKTFDNFIYSQKVEKFVADFNDQLSVWK